MPGPLALSVDHPLTIRQERVDDILFGLPSGQAIARRMGLPVLTPIQLDALTPFSMEKSTPLWFYILKEAELMENGLRLGPVGGRIVGGLSACSRPMNLPIWPLSQNGHRGCRLRRQVIFASPIC